MIVSFHCSETEKVWNGERSRKFGNIYGQALRKLTILDAVAALSQLTGKGNSLEALKGSRTGEYSVRVNDQYRLCFRWENENAVDVEIVDYHD